MSMQHLPHRAFADLSLAAWDVRVEVQSDGLWVNRADTRSKMLIPWPALFDFGILFRTLKEQADGADC